MIDDKQPLRLAWVALGLVLGLGLAGSSACRVINPDHCANQAMPGNQWCATLSSTLRFCSPCVAQFHGCVGSEPRTCPSYAGDDGDGDTGGTEGATSMGMMTTVGTLTAGSGGMSTGAMDTMGMDTTMGGGMDTAVEDTAMDDTTAAAEDSGGDSTTGAESAMGTSSSGDAGESSTG